MLILFAEFPGVLHKVKNLFYKIKDNSRMFFLISITSVVTFTSIGTCFAFWKNNLDCIEKRYPYDFVYSTLGKPEIAEEQTRFLEDLLKEEKYTYKRVILKTLSYEADSEEFHTLISESAYRQLSDQLNLKPIEFSIGEAIYILTDSERKSPLLEVLNSPLTIIGER